MRDDERRIAEMLIRSALDSAREVALFDEEGLIVKSNRLRPIMNELGTSDIQQVLIYQDEAYEEGKNHFGTVTLVFGNEPGVLMSDTSTGKEFLEFLKSIEVYQASFEE